MGRLFWKIFLGFWLTLAVTALGIGVLVHLYNQARWESMADLAAGPRARFVVAAAASALEHGGAGAVESLFAEWPGHRRAPVLVVDDSGTDLLGRAVPQAALERARARLAQSPDAPGLRRVTAPDGRGFILFVPRDAAAPGRGHRRVAASSRFQMRLAITLAASLLFSAGLAWYLTRPLRHLRQASRRLAGGALDTRVMPLMGRRRDEIADLGRDFDHMAERLQALVAAQRRLLHDVSHELRSPLARLQVGVGLARQQPGNAEPALARIEREAERLDELVGQVLALSRLEAGVGEPAEEYVDLASLLEAVVDDARFEAEPSGRGVVLHAPGEVVVKGRAELLRRAFENVVRNAVRYTAAGSEVEVSLEVSAAEDPITVSVCDRGPGVPEADRDRLFEPFFRSSDEGGTRAGYGLGLAIAKRAVEAHGGHIEARNRPGGGLCVSVRLPELAEPAAR